MKHRILIITGFIIMSTIILPQGGFRAFANKTNPTAMYMYIVELHDLWEGGTCDSSTYSITNDGDEIAHPVYHLFYSLWKDWSKDPPDYEFLMPDMEPGQTELFNLGMFTGLPDGFEGFVIVASSEPISGMVIPLPPCFVLITGPEQGVIDISYWFLAAIGEYSYKPTTFTWTVTDHPQVVEDDIIQDLQKFSWTTPGLKEIVVTAENEGGIETDTFTITIYESFNVYLPISLR